MKRFLYPLFGASILGFGGCVADTASDTASEAATETGMGTETGTTTGEPATTTSTSSGAEDESSESGDSTSSGDPQQPLQCPEDEWPNDGSEIEGETAGLSVDSWTQLVNVFSDPGYSSSMSDDSPVGGELSISLKSDTAEQETFAITFDQMSMVEYRGQRVRLRAPVKRIDVERHASLWLRIDAEQTSVVLDNGLGEAGYGTSDWALEEIVVDVPDNAVSMMFGSMLVQRGEILVGDAELMVVSDEVPTTQPNLRRPANSTKCLGELGPDAKQLIHVIGTEGWPQESFDAVLEDFSRDDEELRAGVPTFRVDGEMSGFFGGIYWGLPTVTARVRATLPLRAQDLSGELRLRILAVDADGTESSYVSEPLQLTDDWQEYSVVAELPEDSPRPVAVGIQADAQGTLWVGRGVVERVTDEVPLSELFEG